MSQADLPLYKRIYSSSVTVSGNPYGHTSFIPRPPRPESYKAWSNSAMESAIDAVVKKGFSVRRAAMEYDVPRSALNKQLINSLSPLVLLSLSVNRPVLNRIC